MGEDHGIQFPFAFGNGGNEINAVGIVAGVEKNHIFYLLASGEGTSLKGLSSFPWRKTPMIKSLLLLSLFSCTLYAQVWGPGRAGPDHFNFEVYLGYGGMDSLKGSVKESKDAVLLPGGISVDLQDLGVDEDITTWFAGAKAYNRWVQFLLDYRSSSLDTTGTADREYRLDLDTFGFGGLGLDYLLIPINTEYSIDAETQWLGVGFRFTPLTFNPAGSLRFTPWLHFGVQLISAEYDVDAGVSTDLRYVGFPERTYAVRGQASGKEEAGIPEYGLGGEVRWLFNPSQEFGPELVAQATWKMLDFQGALSSIGVDKDQFRDIDFEYTALEMNLYILLPLSESLDLIAGLYIEQVDVTATLAAKDVFGEYDRDVELSYTLYGVRAGFRF
jgi:hypothetical protein